MLVFSSLIVFLAASEHEVKRVEVVLEAEQESAEAPNKDGRYIKSCRSSWGTSTRHSNGRDSAIREKHDDK